MSDSTQLLISVCIRAAFIRPVIETTEMSKINKAADKDVLFKTPLSAAFLCKNDYGCIIIGIILAVKAFFEICCSDTKTCFKICAEAHKSSWIL